MKQPKTCVIVVGGRTARLFDLPGRGESLVPRDEHVMEAPVVNEPADAQGATYSSVGHSLHRLAPHNGPDRKKAAFAAEIAEKLAEMVELDSFDRLVLVASPKMMGLLRDRLDTVVQSRIWAQIDKNLAQMPVEKISEALDAHLYS